MAIISGVLAGIAGLVILGAALLLPLRRRFILSLRKKTRQELEEMAFDYADDYFTFIGNDHPEVREFKALTEGKDLKGLRRNWGRLSRSFRRLERQAGYQGRPLLMDYYIWHELVLKELEHRHGT